MPSIRVIIPAYRAAATMPTVLDALVPQAVAASAEVVVVDSSADGTADEIRRRWPVVEVRSLCERTLPGRARNLGASDAGTDLLVFLDADATPAPGWLDQLVAALSDDCAAVAGAIGNGTPRSSVGTAGWLLEFSDWLPRQTARRVAHAASASLLVRRTDFLLAGGFPEGLWPGEDTVLTYPWGSSGRLCFAGMAVVDHANRTGVREFLAHQHALGVAFARVCAQTTFPHRRFGRRPWALLGGALRVAALVRRVWRRPHERSRALAVSHVLLLGLVAWTCGVWTGSGRPNRAA